MTNKPANRNESKDKDTLNCSVGVMAHNEEKNIDFLLERLLTQKLETVNITEIIVVASGCTDSTEDIVKEYTSAIRNTKLISESERSGKAAAVNTFIKAATEDILVVVGGDTIPDHDAIEQLVVSFADPFVGMAGARPVPLNEKDNLPGYVAYFLWELHHRLALRSPKCGEMVAFRRVFDALPPDTIVDEPQMEALVRRQGLKVIYEPASIVYNLGPSNLSEIIMRRRSIVSGYIRMAKQTDYRVSTQRLRWWLIWFVVVRVVRGEEPFFRAAFAVAIELISRTLGAWDGHFSKKPLHLWEPAASTKHPSGRYDND
ncbi:glycosyltransferase [bacterium]